MGTEENTNKQLTQLKTLESNLTHIKSTYTRLIVDKAKKGLPVDRLVERLKSTEIQLWQVKERVSGLQKTASNG